MYCAVLPGIFPSAEETRTGFPLCNVCWICGLCLAMVCPRGEVLGMSRDLLVVPSSSQDTWPVGRWPLLGLKRVSPSISLWKLRAAPNMPLHPQHTQQMACVKAHCSEVCCIGLPRRSTCFLAERHCTTVGFVAVQHLQAQPSRLPVRAALWFARHSPARV